MAKLAELKKYLNYEFSTGCYTGEDYKSFQAKYINYLKTMCKENHWQLVNVSRNHYCFSAFIQSSQNKFVYISISDVRYFSNEWYSNSPICNQPIRNEDNLLYSCYFDLPYSKINY